MTRTVLEGIAVLAALALLGILLAAARAAVSRLRDGRVRRVLEGALGELQTAVMSVEQAYCSGLRASTPDGRLPDTAAHQAMERALGEVKRNLGPRRLAELQRAVGGDLDSWLRSRAEGTIQRGKMLGTLPRSGGRAAPPPPTPRGPATGGKRRHG